MRLGSPRHVVLTNGPRDSNPDLSDDGSHLVFLREDKDAIIHCVVSGARATDCQTVHVDKGIDALIGLSPRGDELAFVTSDLPRLGTSIRILSLNTRRVRDLGRIPLSCPMSGRWASGQGLWILPNRAGPWTEISSQNGRPTGRTWKPENSSAETCEAQPPNGNRFKLRFESHLTSAIRIVD